MVDVVLPDGIEESNAEFFKAHGIREFEIRLAEQEWASFIGRHRYLTGSEGFYGGPLSRRVYVVAYTNAVRKMKKGESYAQDADRE